MECENRVCVWNECQSLARSNVTCAANVNKRGLLLQDSHLRVNTNDDRKREGKMVSRVNVDMCGDLIVLRDVSVPQI